MSVCVCVGGVLTEDTLYCSLNIPGIGGECCPGIRLWGGEGERHTDSLC